MIILIILLSLCLGFANAARGSGIKGGKVLVVLMMALSAYTITESWIIALLFPLPLCAFWWKPGGTGSSMPAILSWFHAPFISENLQWRAFEAISVIVYSLICGILWRAI